MNTKLLEDTSKKILETIVEVKHGRSKMPFLTLEEASRIVDTDELISSLESAYRSLKREIKENSERV